MRQTKTTDDLAVCPRCGRIDNGAPKCRDHPPKERILATMTAPAPEEEPRDE